MKLKQASCLTLALCSVMNLSFADYRVKIPLELSNGGRLPNGSIVIGTGNNNGSGGNTGGETTDPTTPTDCYYSEDMGSSSFYIEGYDADTGSLLESMVIYNGTTIVNGVKGQTKNEIISNGYRTVYSEVCLNGQAPQEGGLIEPTQSWKSDECRFGNGYGDGYNYSFTQVSGSNDEEGDFTGKQLFTDASVGQWGNFHFTDTNYTKPYTGYVDTSYGQYQYDNEGISLGSVYFFKGSNLQSTSTDANGRTVSNYDVCLYIVN